jgi:hypothetical protein
MKPRAVVIGVHRRPNSGLPNSSQGLETDGQHLKPSFPNVMFHLTYSKIRQQFEGANRTGPEAAHQTTLL